MDKDIPLHLQEIIFSSSNPEVSRTIGKLEKSGKLKKIAPRVYTPNLDEAPRKSCGGTCSGLSGSCTPASCSATDRPSNTGLHRPGIQPLTGIPLKFKWFLQIISYGNTIHGIPELPVWFLAIEFGFEI